ncbi:hypothetical protein ALQ14_03172 [Pseudomonas savastanoi pv. glycinea]|nr:hypothetical protein ALQ14_03172 [Pseudomonas savastanoi pv. glycinea]
MTCPGTRQVGSAAHKRPSASIARAFCFARHRGLSGVIRWNECVGQKVQIT